MTITMTTLEDWIAALYAGEPIWPYLADWLEDQGDARAEKVRRLMYYATLGKSHVGYDNDDKIYVAKERLLAERGVEIVRLWAILCVRFTPAKDGVVVDLLKDARSINGLAAAELRWCGLISEKAIRSAAYAAYAAADAAAAAAAAAADAAAYYAADAAAADTAAARHRARIWAVSLADLLCGESR